jgi:S1-C subfamily serine protease
VLVVLGLTADFSIPQKTIPEKIVESVVVVDTASGIVVHSNKDYSLVLTAYHVLDQSYTEMCSDESVVKYIYFEYAIDGVTTIERGYPADLVAHSEREDLALLVIYPGKILPSIRISKYSPKLGEDIYLASNPSQMYRSLKKGIISSTDRWVEGTYAWEISGGVIFGSSGGGAFDMDGKLVGILRAVKILKTDHCYDLWAPDGSIQMWIRCMELPLPFMGYISPTGTVRWFLLKSDFRKDFDYLR